MESYNCWRNDIGIERGGRRKREGAGVGGRAVEGVLVSGLGKRHCICIRCCVALDWDLGGIQGGSRPQT